MSHEAYMCVLSQSRYKVKRTQRRKEESGKIAGVGVSPHHHHTHLPYVQLDNIMENEVYKIAVELLERFDPNNPALKKVQEPKREDLRQRKGHKDIGVCVCVLS